MSSNSQCERAPGQSSALRGHARPVRGNLKPLLSQLLAAGLALQLGCASFMAAAQTPATPPAPVPQSAPAKPAEKPAEGEPAKDGKPAPKKEVIEVQATGEYDARKDDTATKIIVNSAEIMKNGDTQVLDVLKRLPGVTVTGNAVRMRGLGAGYTQILVDGERPPPGFTLENLAPDLIEKIEVVRAATAEYSTQAIAGTINIVLKKKISFAQRDLRLTYAQGSFFRSPNVNFTLSDKSGQLGYTVSGSLYRTHFEGFTDSSELTRDAAGTTLVDRQSLSRFQGNANGFNVAPRLMWSLGAGESLNLQAFMNSNRSSGGGEFDYSRALGSTVPVFSNRNSFDNNNHFGRVDLNWIKKFESGTKLDTKLGIGQFAFESRNHLLGFNAAGQMNLDRSGRNKSEETSTSWTGKISHPIIEGHDFVTGWDFNRAQRKDNNFQKDVPIPGVLPAVTAFDADERFEATVTKMAGFMQDEWNVSKAWSVYFGLRWEGIRTQSGGGQFLDSTSTSSVWSPLFQTLYKIPGRPGEQVRFALTRTYKAPSTFSLVPRKFSVVDNRPTAPDSTGNPNLKPELATGVDAAYEKFFGQNASWSIAANIRKITGYQRTALLFQDGRWLSMPINDGDAETRSIEFDTKLPVQTLWKEGPPLDLRFNLSRNWSRVDVIPGPNNRLDAQVPLSGTFGADYRMQGGKIVAGGSLSYRRGGIVRTSETQTLLQSSKKDLDLYGLYKFDAKNQVRLTLSNVLKPPQRNDRTYADGNITTFLGSEQPSRMFIRVSLEMKL